MKKFLLLTVSAFLGLSSFAQSKHNSDDSSRPFFGARLSIDASIPCSMKTEVGSVKLSTKPFGTGGGVSVGGVVNFPIVSNLYVEPGIDLYYHTNSINMGNLTGNPEIEDNDFTARSLRKFGMRVPVQIGYRYDFSSSQTAVSVFTGPVLNVGFSNDYYITSKEIEGVKVHSSGSMYDEMQRVNLSWRIGFGVTFLNNYYVALSGDIGMLNMLKQKDKDSKIKMHENGFQLTLGYNFK